MVREHEGDGSVGGASSAGDGGSASSNAGDGLAAFDGASGRRTKVIKQGATSCGVASRCTLRLEAVGFRALTTCLPGAA
jgi:hypothetical protein